MDYIKILEKIKRKIDLMMEKIDPEKPLEPRHQSVNFLQTKLDIFILYGKCNSDVLLYK